MTFAYAVKAGNRLGNELGDAPMRDYFITLARYNAWANARLFNACAELPKDELARDRQAFFGSVLGTLNHVLVVDRLWLGRLTGVDAGLSRLDEILFASLFELRQAREAEDRKVLGFVQSLTEARLAGDLSYRTRAGQHIHTPMPYVLGHLFNHQTHHRGQVHHMLIGVPAVSPPLDLVYYLREVS